MTKCNSEHVAATIAAQQGLLFGLCVHDGKFYVGTWEQLQTIACVNLVDPTLEAKHLENRTRGGW